MLALAAVNALGLALFAGLYVAAGLRWLSHGAFLAGVAVFFGAVTALWVHLEGRGAGRRGVLERIGRAAAALLLVGALGPIAVLMPLFLLDAQLPREAAMDHVISRTMVLLLISIALVAMCNLAGGIVRAAVVLRARVAGRGSGA